MKKLLALSFLLSLTACLSVMQLGKSIRIEGPKSNEERILLGQHILKSLPQDEVRRLIKVEFPELTAWHLQNIYVSHTVRNFHEKDGTTRQEIYLDVTINNPPIRNHEQVLRFAESLVRDRLEKERLILSKRLE